ncbi:F-box domain containing protein [Tanacetum coccineum]
MAIMNRLPVKSLLQFRTVSKQWKFSIDNFNFIRNYGCRDNNSYCFNLSYKHDIEGFVYAVDENLVFRHVDSNLNVYSLTPIATSKDHGFVGYPFDYRVALGFGSIAGGLDHVNPVIRLPLEHGISRVLGKDDHSNPSVATNPVAASIT